MQKAIAENRIWFGKDGNGVPRIKTYLNAKERGLTPETILFANEVSTNEKAKMILKNYLMVLLCLILQSQQNWPFIY